MEGVILNCEDTVVGALVVWVRWIEFMWVRWCGHFNAGAGNWCKKSV